MAVEPKINYKNAVVLAPMVRVSTLPLRLLCLKYGATIVFGPEIIDYKLINCKSKKCADSNTISFVNKQKETRLIFKTLAQKKEPVVCQIGSCDPVKFLRASIKVCKFVHGIDLNMGCPKPFSINKGIGASLLHPKKMDIVADILKTWKRNKVSNSMNLSVKIRLLESNKKTIELCRMIEKCDVDCITIHARYTKDRSDTVCARHELVKNIVNVSKIPIIYNGDIFKYEDINKYKELTNCDGVMIARGATYNPSIFSCDGFININEIVSQYIDLNVQYKYPIHNAKFVMEKMILSKPYFKKKSSVFQEFHKTLTYDDCKLVNAKLKNIAKKYVQPQYTQNSNNNTQNNAYGPSRATIKLQVNHNWPYAAPKNNNNNKLSVPNLTLMVGVRLFYENVKMVQAMNVSKSSHKATMALLCYIEHEDGIYIDGVNIGFTKQHFVSNILKTTLAAIHLKVKKFLKGYEPNGDKIFKLN